MSDNEPGRIENATHNTFPKLHAYFKYSIAILNIVTMALLPIIFFVTTDIYEKVKIRRLKCIRMMRKKTNMILIYVGCNKSTSTVQVYAESEHFPKNSSFFSQFHLTKRMTFMSKFTTLLCSMFFKSKNKYLC
jgi:hypothetical protein